MRLLRLCQTCVQQRAMLSGAQCFGYSSRLSCTPSNLNRIQVRNATPHAATTPQSTARPISPLANFAQTNGLQWHTANQRVKLTPKPLLRPSAAGVDLAQPASEPSPQAVETWQTSRAVLLDACCMAHPTTDKAVQCHYRVNNGCSLHCVLQALLMPSACCKLSQTQKAQHPS